MFRVARIASFLVVALGGACTDGDLARDAGHGGHEELVACEEEHECHFLGAGAMCMGGRCMRMDPPPVVVVPPARDADVTLPLLTDTNPDPAVFEGKLVVTTAPLTIDEGVATPAYVYRDGHALDRPATSPGPLIDVVEGTLVRITIENALDEPTTVHWHGLVLPIEMDGVPDMPNPPIASGESFTAEFIARHPALYWYHPHVRSDVQNERGLHGAFVIRPSTPDPVVVERVLVLDDILLTADGAIEGPEEGSSHYVTDDGELMMTFTGMMGRQGNRLLVNGVVHPRLAARRGSVERWRIVNTANARFFRLALDGHRFVQVGSDAGALAAPRVLDEILLAPSERIDVLVVVSGAPGAEVALRTLPHDRGHTMADPEPYTVLTLALDDAERRVVVDTLPTLTSPVPALDEDLVPAHTITMGEELVRGGRVGFSLNGELWPEVTPLSSTVGALETWEIVNDTHMEHPFHLHGTRFQVTSRGPNEGALVPVVEREWKDTVVVHAEETLRFVARFEPEFPGHWMFHCHIFEHTEGGMMGMVDVGAAGVPAHEASH